MSFPDAFENLPWHALNTQHRRFAIGSATALRYPADVAPFAGVRENSAVALRELVQYLAPGEKLYLVGAKPATLPELASLPPVPLFQMLAPGPVTPAGLKAPAIPVSQLGAEDADAMVKLTDIAFPGFFRKRTYLLGTYYGIRLDGELIAMAGERMALPGFVEISAVCTHPEHTGKGFAAYLISLLMQDHANAGLRSFLHVNAENERAIGLYKRMGFCHVREGRAYPICRATDENC